MNCYIVISTVKGEHEGNQKLGVTINEKAFKLNPRLRMGDKFVYNSGFHLVLKDSGSFKLRIGVYTPTDSKTGVLNSVTGIKQAISPEKNQQFDFVLHCAADSYTIKGQLVITPLREPFRK